VAVVGVRVPANVDRLELGGFLIETAATVDRNGRPLAGIS
jgi:hypothetical protein